MCAWVHTCADLGADACGAIWIGMKAELRVAGLFDFESRRKISLGSCVDRCL